MTHAPAPGPPAPHRPSCVRVVVDDVPELDDLVREAARRAQLSDRAIELVEPAVPESDHAARARMIRLMDEALEVARQEAPGVQVRVGNAIELPRPRHPA